MPTPSKLFAKLGRRVNAQASLQMQAQGLGHYPISADEFPLYQYENIRVFKKGGAVDRLYEKMLNNPDDDKKSNRDAVFIGDAASGQLRAKIDRIKAMVCDD